MRWKCTCAYDGTHFCGWQSQANRQAIQDIIEARLHHIFKYFIRIHGSSRTDAGVHAKAQVFHFDADWKHDPESLKRAINSQLNNEIQITHIERTDNTFHSRFSAKGKRYRYYFKMHPTTPFEARYMWHITAPHLDIDRMKNAAKLFLGTHNFRGFAGKVLPKENPIKTLTSVQIFSQEDHFIFETIGSGYLYRMVRMLMGTLIMYGSGKIDTEFINHRLQLSNLHLPILTAPAHGLFLEEIFY